MARDTEEFEAELLELCKKYKMTIGTCGCCGIWIQDLEDMKYAPDCSLPDVYDIIPRPPKKLPTFDMDT